MLKEIKGELFDFGKLGDGVYSPINATLLMAIIFADELAIIQEISASRRVGVATRHYTRASSFTPEQGGHFSIDPSQVPRSFGLVRSILNEEGHFFPKIESISHALKLRKNPSLRAFRAQLREFHVQLASGDRQAIEEIRKEVKQAKQALERAGKWNLCLRWLTYISLPAGTVEALLGGIPIVGTSLAVLSVAGTAANTHATHKNQWVMFGM